MGLAEIETTPQGYLVNSEEWTESIAEEIAVADGIPELTERHMDVITYLRDEYVNNDGNQPSERHIVKSMSKKWGEKISTKDLYDLFPMQPSKQASKIAGLPETKRKGGY